MLYHAAFIRRKRLGKCLDELETLVIMGLLEEAIEKAKADGIDKMVEEDADLRYPVCAHF